MVLAPPDQRQHQLAFRKILDTITVSEALENPVMGKFISGESGNPGGRPSGYGEIRDIARQHTESAINTLVKIMGDSDATPSSRVGAATALLDRGWGRPAQTIEASVNPGVNQAALEIALGDSAIALLDKIRGNSTPSLETSATDGTA